MQGKVKAEDVVFLQDTVPYSGILKKRRHSRLGVLQYKGILHKGEA
jgi:hypothetical protein